MRNITQFKFEKFEINMGDRAITTKESQVFSSEGLEKLNLLRVKGEEVSKLEKQYDVVNKAYDLVVELYDNKDVTDAEFRHRFGGIADDYKMAKMRMEVAQDEFASIT